jgi:hypothetical protein
MKFLFLIGSALKHFQESEFSAFTEQQRFEQTLETIKWVREKVPTSYIILFECSYTSISEEHKNILREKCDLFLDFSTEPVLQAIYENIQKRPELITYGKSLLETRGLLNTLYYIREHNVFSDSQRVFKLTGRYLLNDNNLYDLVSPDGKTMYLRNMDLRTGKVERVPEVVVPVTEERKKQSIRDIKEMIKFYESPVGKKIAKNAGPLFQKSSAAGQEWGMQLQGVLMKYMQ